MTVTLLQGDCIREREMINDDLKLRCSVCHKVIDEPADSYINFGTVLDLEPPEPILLCKECLSGEIDFWRKIGIMPQHWKRASYETDLAKELGYSLVSAGGFTRWEKLWKY